MTPKCLAFIVAFGSGVCAFAQTPPIRPQTPDVPVVSPFQLQSGAVTPVSLNADEAFKRALTLHTSVRIAEAGWDQALARLMQAQSGLKPQISVSANETDLTVIRRGNFAPQNAGWSNQGAFNISQLLFDFGRTRDQIREQKFFVSAAELGLDASKEDLYSTVKQTFYAYKQNQQLVVAAQANLTNRNAQLALADARLMTGLGAPSDFVKAKTGVADATISLVDAQSSALSSRIALALAIGLDPRTPIEARDSDEGAESSGLDSLVTEATSNRPEVKASTAVVNANLSALSFAKKGNLPSVSLQGVYATHGVSDPLNTMTTSVGVAMSWPLSDGGLTAGRVREAEANVRISQENLKQTVQNIVSEVSNAVVSVDSAQKRVNLAQIQLTNAREQLRIAEGRYRGGLGSFLELTDAQDSVYSADKNLVQANADLLRAKVALGKATGMPYRK